MRASGLNAVTTYVEWSLHNPHDGSYAWDGIANVEQFIRLAGEEDLYVILRPGPYICAERDMVFIKCFYIWPQNFKSPLLKWNLQAYISLLKGGLPYWLLTKYPNIKLRTSDPSMWKTCSRWLNKMFNRVFQFTWI